MHIPDGLIAPPVYLGAAALAVPAWALAVHRVARGLDERTVPRLAMITAIAFVLSSVMIPLPGGASAHLTGIGLLTLLFGPGAAFLAFSVVLGLQVALLGMGGITTLPITALAIGLVGAGVIDGTYRVAGRRSTLIGVAAPVALGIVAASVLLALVLGVQPAFGRDASGQPLYFPFGPSVTVPVIVAPHVALGVAEGILTWFALRLFRPRPASS